MTEITFNKYQENGSNYHWCQISRSLKKRNLFVLARYLTMCSQLGDVRDQTVLDVGCGDGVLTSFVAQKQPRSVVGVDVSEEALLCARRHTQQHKNIEFLHGSVYALPFSDHCFDSIISSEVIEHVEHPAHMLKEIKRVWNQHGSLIVSTPIRQTKHPLDKMHVQEFFCEDFQQMISQTFPDMTCTFLSSHSIFWTEFQNRLLFGRPFFKLFLNACNLLVGVNPFLVQKGWRHFLLQTVVITCPKNLQK